jgi:hypothetical protein
VSDRSLIDGPRLSGDAKEQRGKLYKINGGVLAALPPIVIEHTFDQIGVKKLTERCEAADRNPNVDGLAHQSHELGAANLDCRRLARGASPAARRPADLGQASEVGLDILTEASRELLEGGTSKRGLWRGHN